MAVVLVIVAVAAVFAIAAVVVGREARRLAAQAPRPTFDFDEAVEWVCRHVTDDVAAVLSPEDVRTILNWHLEYFRMKGVSTNGSSASHDGRVVVGGAETVDYVLARAQALGSPYTPAQVHAVLEAQMTYLEAIGAIGPEAGGEK
ncbi:MAG: hypothetical protein JWO37_2888 [Acidimicrobiales bacterium]|jgi:hypothetical protein|nr:hypothetical protein [Acidimicrobiales bacterium]